MLRLEDITTGTTKWPGSDMAEVIYKGSNGAPGEILYRDTASILDLVEAGYRIRIR